MFIHLKISARLNSSSVRPSLPVLMSTTASEPAVAAAAPRWQENVFKLYLGQNKKGPNKALKTEVFENFTRCTELIASFVVANITISTAPFFSVI